MTSISLLFPVFFLLLQITHQNTLLRIGVGSLWDWNSTKSVTETTLCLILQMIESQLIMHLKMYSLKHLSGTFPGLRLLGDYVVVLNK